MFLLISYCAWFTDETQLQICKENQSFVGFGGIYAFFLFNIKHSETESGGRHLKPQLSGGGGWRISVVLRLTSLTYIVSSRTPKVTQTLFQKHKQTKEKLWLWVCMHMCAPQHMCGGQRTMLGGGSVLSFHCLGSGSWTHVVRLSGKHPYLPSHLIGPNICDFEHPLRVLECIFQGQRNSGLDMQFFNPLPCFLATSYSAQ